MTTQTGRDPEPFGHTPTCGWIETRTPDPQRCDKCRWMIRHGAPDPRHSDPATDGALDARMESES